MAQGYCYMYLEQQQQENRMRSLIAIDAANLETAEDLLKALVKLENEGRDLSTIYLENDAAGATCLSLDLVEEELTDFSLVYNLQFNWYMGS